MRLLAVMVIDCLICAASAPVFSVDNALAAALSMVVTGIVVDRVIDGANVQRTASGRARSAPCSSSASTSARCRC